MRDSEGLEHTGQTRRLADRIIVWAESSGSPIQLLTAASNEPVSERLQRDDACSIGRLFLRLLPAWLLWKAILRASPDFMDLLQIRM